MGRTGGLMKFVCDRCRTRYSIADEKVRGKVLKVRCKTCSNIIVVRESTAALQLAAAGGAGVDTASAAPQPQASAPASPPAAAGIAWWVAIKGQQQGPLAAPSVEKLFRDGQISAKSYVWNETLPAWQRLRDVPEFAHLAGGAPAQPPPPPPPADDAAGAQVLNLQEARAQRQNQQAAPAPAAGTDPFAAAAAASSVPDSGSDQPPRESTRVFIMNAGLANRAAKHKTYAVAAFLVFSTVVGAGYADWAGIIQIPFLHRAISFAAETAGLPEPPRRKFLAKWDENDGDKATQCALMGINCPEPEAKPVRRAARKNSGGVGDLDLDGAFGGPGNADSNIGRANGQGADIDMPDLLGSNRGKANDIASLFSRDKKQRFKPKAKIEAPSVSAGSGLDGEQIFKVVRNNQEAIKNCMETAAKQGSTVGGKQYLVVTISPRGTVPVAKFKNALVSASPVGECITKRAKKWKFPPFAGQAFDVEIPLILSTSL